MTRQLAFALGIALVLPAVAQEQGYEYQDDGSGWTDQGGGERAGEQGPSVDVNVDMGAGGAAVSFDTFRDGLAPYGEWVTAGTYGRVWRPHVAAGWRPYYYGRWEWTDEGWLWVSDESWGWATYHYGRWAVDPAFGWVWVPGYQWAPAWVSWRYSPDYIGWAPLAPGLSVYVSSYPTSYAWWSFVPCQRFVGVPVYSVAYTGGQVRGIFYTTQPAPPRAAVYGMTAPAWGGPARPFIERRVGHAIAPVRIQPVASAHAMGAPSRAGVVSIYRPEMRPPSAGRPVVGGGPSRPWGSPSAAGFAPARPGAAAPAYSGSNGNWRGNAQQAPRSYSATPQGAPRPYAPPPHGAPPQYAPQGPTRRYAPVQQPAPRQIAPQEANRGHVPAPTGGNAGAQGGGHGGGQGGAHGGGQGSGHGGAPAQQRDR